MPQRSPIIFWLLLAATVAVDLVAICGIYGSEESGEQATIFFVSLAYGQLSLLCVWAVADRRLMRFRWLVPVAAALVVSFLMTGSEGYNGGQVGGQIDWQLVARVTGIVLIHVGFVLVLLRFVVPQAWIARHTTLEDQRRQFSTLHLLILMTCVAATLVLLRENGGSDVDWADVATFCLANFILLFGIMYLLRQNGPRLWRIAACMLLAIGISVIADWTQYALSNEINPWAFFIVQAVVLVAWLAARLPAHGTSDANPESMLPLGIA